MRSFLSPIFLFPTFYLTYIGLATVGFFICREYLFKPRGYFEGVSLLSYLISFLSIAVFILGYKLGEKTNLGEKSEIKYLLLAAIFALSFVILKIADMPMHLSLIFIAILLLLSKLNLKQMTYFTTLLAFSVFIITLVKEGLPFFSRESYITDINRAAFLVFANASAAFSTVYFRRIVALPIVLMLSFMGLAFGFKGDAISVLITSAFAGLFAGRIRMRDVLIFLIIALAIISVFGTIIAVRTYDTWQISPLEYIFYRPAFTFLVFNEIVKLSFPFGFLGEKALLVLKFDIVSTEVLGYEKPVSITTTIIGAFMLAYGILGVVAFSFVLGFYLSQMFKIRDYYDACLYVLAVVHTLVLIEVGTPFSSLLYYLSLFYLKIR